MSVLVVGSIAFDTVETPFGKVEGALGGSATFFSCAASLFTDIRLVGVIGRDFPEERLKIFSERGIDTAGLQIVDGDTFNWTGRYEGDMSQAETVEVNLNVFGTFDPILPDSYRDSEFVFLANGAPALQLKVLDQVQKPKLIVCDTMNLWIDTALDDLKALLRRVDGIILNDGEARMLTGQDNLVVAGRAIREMGPTFVVIKKGEHGGLAIVGDDIISLPAYPLPVVKDPTGAGDSFAGGFMGYLAEAGAIDAAAMKKAIAYGTVTASFTVEDFSLDRLHNVTREELDGRLAEFSELLTIR